MNIIDFISIPSRKEVDINCFYAKQQDTPLNRCISRIPSKELDFHLLKSRLLKTAAIVNCFFLILFSFLIFTDIPSIGICLMPIAFFIATKLFSYLKNKSNRELFLAQLEKAVYDEYKKIESYNEQQVRELLEKLRFSPQEIDTRGLASANPKYPLEALKPAIARYIIWHRISSFEALSLPKNGDTPISTNIISKKKWTTALTGDGLSARDKADYLRAVIYDPTLTPVRSGVLI